MKHLGGHLLVQLIPISGELANKRFPSYLVDVDHQHIILRSDNFPKLPNKTPLRVEFQADRDNFFFDTVIYSIVEENKVYLKKPVDIKRKQRRDAPRFPLGREIHYTHWTRNGITNAHLVDISETGMKMTTTEPEQKDTLINLVFDQIDVTCPGTVIWCQKNKDNQYLFEIGVRLITIPEDTRSILQEYLKKVRAPASS